jgi:hypothetical protein
MHKKSKRVFKRKNRKSLRKRGGAAAKPTSPYGYDALMMLRTLRPDKQPTTEQIKDLSEQLNPSIISAFETLEKQIKITPSIMLNFLENIHNIQLRHYSAPLTFNK